MEMEGSHDIRSYSRWVDFGSAGCRDQINKANPNQLHDCRYWSPKQRTSQSSNNSNTQRQPGIRSYRLVPMVKFAKLNKLRQVLSKKQTDLPTIRPWWAGGGGSCTSDPPVGRGGGRFLAAAAPGAFVRPLGA